MGLSALELILLAPLGYLFVSALALFVKALVEKDGEEWLRALHMVVGIKALGTSLLISILAADLIGRILREGHLDVVLTAIELVAFCVLIGYLVVLEKSLPKHEPDENVLKSDE
jgi:hypothetical protein